MNPGTQSVLDPSDAQPNGGPCPARPAPRHRALALSGLLLGTVLLASALLAPRAQAMQGDTRTTLFFGTTRYSTGDDTTFGSSFGAIYGYELQNDLVWSTGVAFGFTDGEREVDGETYELQANTTTLHTGVVRIFNRRGAVEPFVGGGLSFLSYTLDFDYPDSPIGETSGLGPGIYGTAGMDIHISRTFTFIPAWVYSAHSITQEDGEAAGIYAGGLTLSLRVGF